MRKFLMLVLLGWPLLLVAQTERQQSYLDYIARWRDMAVQEEQDYGIPAAITMAQGLLESGAGLSELAREANNHFGVKCTSDWLGDSYMHDDDKKNDCFRKYADAADSYRDHSLFLKRARYQTCFEIAVEDYEGWARQLKACGYATDPAYPEKLIRIIETYGLDTLTSPLWQAPTDSAFMAGRSLARTAKTSSDNTAAKKAVVTTASAPIATIRSNPEPEYVAPKSAYEERKQFYIEHKKKRANGRQYVLAREGDTYANVAFRLNIRERDLREWNDALGRTLYAGEPLYLSLKRRYAPKEKTYMWVHPGESLWDICQREGVQMKSVQKLNGFAPDIRVFKTRQQILLRKEKKERDAR